MSRKSKTEKQEKTKKIKETKKKTPEETEEKKEEKKEKKTSKKKVSQADFEKKVIELADKGLTSEKIGEELRNQGIHPQEYKKKISKILKEKDKYINPDLKNLEEKFKGLQKHYEKNKGDKRAMREKDRVFAELRNMKKYFKVAIK